MTKCIFCNGTGKITHYHHIENGKCFRCNGTGKALTNKTDHNGVTCAGCNKAIKKGETARITSTYERDEEKDFFLHDNENCISKYMKTNKRDEIYSNLTTV